MPGQSRSSSSSSSSKSKAPDGWEVGQPAPSDKYAKVNADGSVDRDSISDEPVEGYGTHIAVKGDTLTLGTLIALGYADPPAEGEPISLT